ncbi:MAG: FGGY family carbohydrate kinase [Christensenellaceae bacterium]
MSKKIIAWDLGTGGNKASLYDSNGICIGAAFVPYNTTYPAYGWHEQRPADWWAAVIKSTRLLLEQTRADKSEISCCGISGHSLGAVPMGKNGELLRDYTPIWSDGRAVKQAQTVFSKFDEEKWYMMTGNGFTPAFYTAFKILWYKDNEPEMYEKIDKIIGTKDYINYKLTGKICTDPSYASGCGVWDLKKWAYSPELMNAMNLPERIFPEAVASTTVIGHITKEAADLMGLTTRVQVVAGGVDNACMALGAKAYKEGSVYNSLGSSSWIAVSSKKPLLEKTARPYVFAHVVPKYFASAMCIAAGGTAFRWIRDELCKELTSEAKRTGKDEYELMTQEAASSPVGANKLLFNPSMNGGMPMDKSYQMRGAFIGLDLIHTRADLLRASMEGISMSLRLCLDKLRELTKISDEILLVGGGSRSAVWRQIYADVYKVKVRKSNIDQQAAALGAAACAAVGTGMWSDFDEIDSLHIMEKPVVPIIENMQYYDKVMKIFKKVSADLSDAGDLLATL